MKEIKVRDLVEIRDIKNVIQLADLENPGLKEFILNSFYLTDEVGVSLKRLLQSIAEARGKGCFIQGNFGSGKSHFLSILSILLDSDEAWEILSRQDQTISGYKKGIMHQKLLPVKISLVEHSSREFLEDIFIGNLFREFKRRTGNELEGGISRKETFENIRSTLDTKGYGGLVIIIDELSEFLRSKTDGRSYNEDVRFLQFLGEEGERFPLWTIASLQERIEVTGEIPREIFNKIKDRYPLRLELGKTHLEELISKWMIRKKEHSTEIIEGFYDEIKICFNSFPIDKQRFTGLYPVHPVTVTILDMLKPLFSQHRGVIDFIHKRITGDAGAGIRGILDENYTFLLTPDVIFDHFLSRIREIGETSIYIEKVFRTHELELPSIFQDPIERALAVKFLKILILQAISPLNVVYSAKHFIEMVVHRITNLDSTVNYEYSLTILKRLAREGPYIGVKKHENPLSEKYFLDLEADIRLIVKRKLEFLRKTIFVNDRRIFQILGQEVQETYLPLRTWLRAESLVSGMKWQYTLRQSRIFLTQVNDLGEDKLMELLQELQEAETDLCLIVGTTCNVELQLRHFEEKIKPLLRNRSYEAVVFWFPLTTDGDQELMKNLTTRLLLDEYQGDSSKTGEGIRKYLEEEIRTQKDLIRDKFTRAYAQGDFHDSEGKIPFSLVSEGLLPFEKILEKLSNHVLRKRFPAHESIAPSREIFTGILKEDFIESFLRTGELTAKTSSQSALKNSIEAVLKPMGIVKKKGEGFVLSVEPKRSPIVSKMLDKISSNIVPINELYSYFRKSTTGLTRQQFEVLILSLIFSGQAVPYTNSRKRNLDTINARTFENITELGPGELLSQEYRSMFREIPLISHKHLDEHFSLSTQEQVWQKVKELKEIYIEIIEKLLTRVEHFSNFSGIGNLNLDALRRDCNLARRFFQETRTSLSSKDGLEYFLTSLKAFPESDSLLKRIDAGSSFFEIGIEKYLRVHDYMNNSLLSIPDDPEYLLLKTRYVNISELLKKNDAAVTHGFLEILSDNFNKFLEEYIKCYEKEHRRIKDRARFEYYFKIKESTSYRLLSALGSIKVLSASNSIEKVERILTSIQEKQCNNLDLINLQKQPACQCNFRIGDTLELSQPREIEDMVSHGIFEYLDCFKSQNFEEKLLPYVTGLEETGNSEMAQKIRFILQTAHKKIAGPEEIEEFLGILNRDTIKAFNEAFSGKIMIVDKNLDSLYTNLHGKKLPVKRVREIIDEWIYEGRGLSGETLLKMEGSFEPGKPLSQIDPLDDTLKEHFPVLLQLKKTRGRKEFLAHFFLSHWLKQYPEISVDSFNVESLSSSENTEIRVKLEELWEHLFSWNPDFLEPLVYEAQGYILDSPIEGRMRLVLENLPLQMILERERTFPFLLQEAFEHAFNRIRNGEKIKTRHTADAGTAKNPACIRKLGTVASELLDTFEQFIQNIEYLSGIDSSAIADFREWEKIYRTRLSTLDYLYSSIRAQMVKNDMFHDALLSGYSEKIKLLEVEFSRNFETFYNKLSSDWISGQAKRPFVIQDVVDKKFMQKFSAKSIENSPNFFLLDGMRLDVYSHLRTHFFPALHGSYRILEERLLWAYTPTDTATQLGHLREADPAFESRLEKIMVIDEKIHTSRSDLLTFCSEVTLNLMSSIAIRLNNMLPGTRMIVFADHGFRQDPQFAIYDKYSRSRYVHGGCSPFEVIVPMVVLEKI